MKKLALVALVLCLAIGGFALSSKKNMRAVTSTFRKAIIGRNPGATLTIESIPSQAMVFINGDDTGKKTPLTIENIESELVHDVRLELEGEAATTSTVSLKAGQKHTLTLAFKGAMSACSIKTDPTGADVTLDGRSIGQFTPATIQLRVGKEAKIRITKVGYHPYEQTLTPERGKDIKIDVALKKTQELKKAEALEKAALKKLKKEKKKKRKKRKRRRRR